jgi:LacI family transcriptional regulator
MTSITAVEEPMRELGFQGARLLHRLLAGHPAPTQPLRVAAERVNSRSTTIAPTLTQAISRALRFIEENATRGISVSDVMAFQQTSRVTFERNFREAIGCPPGEQIRKVRMAHAENLLRTTNLSVAEVGKQCGFDTIAKFSTFFKNAAGISPLKFRHQHRLDHNHNPLHLNGESRKDAQESE